MAARDPRLTETRPGLVSETSDKQSRKVRAGMPYKAPTVVWKTRSCFSSHVATLCPGSRGKKQKAPEGNHTSTTKNKKGQT